MDSLPRVGADETIVDRSADVIGLDVEEQDRLVEDFGRVRELLASAPADRG